MPNQSDSSARFTRERAPGVQNRRFGTFLKGFRGMYIGYDEKQGGAPKGAAATTTTNCSHPRSGMRSRLRGHRPSAPRDRRQDGTRRLADGRVARGIRRSRLLRRRTVRDVRRVRGHRRTDPDAHGQHRRPDPHAVRHPGAEGLLPPKISRGRSPSVSATPNPMPAPTSLRCSAEPFATATSSSSMARRPGPRSPGTPITSGSQHGRTPT